eukprot:NODE_105_length_19280_cov_0.929461.p8 type:complete len:265 gc:universal NODE_105_length_19280_cov_0.929461:17705-18499(+)
MVNYRRIWQNIILKLLLILSLIATLKILFIGIFCLFRDIKPENIMVDKRGNVKLIDFGFAGVAKNSKKLKTFVGSPEYAAPEILNCQEYDGTKVDIWSLGCILYVMVVGKAPFQGEPFRIYEKIMNTDFELPSDLSQDCQNLIRNTLKRDADQRLTTDEIARHPWMADDKHSISYKRALVDSNSIQAAKELLSAKETERTSRPSRIFTVAYLLQEKKLNEEILMSPKEKYKTFFNARNSSKSLIIEEPKEILKTTIVDIINEED